MAGFDVSLEAFTGPFELLFHLIEVNKMDIYDIPIAELTTQYMEYMTEAASADMDSISGFLLMAAELLEIKSAMLLPLKTAQDNAEQEDPRERLTRMLVVYKQFKDIAAMLKEREEQARFYIFKDNNEKDTISKQLPDTNELLDGLTIARLAEVYADIIKRRDFSVDPIRSGFGTVSRDLYTIESKIAELTQLLKHNKTERFSRFIENSVCKDEAVAFFLAVLEMIKLSLVAVKQNKNFTDFSIEWSGEVETE